MLLPLLWLAAAAAGPADLTLLGVVTRREGAGVALLRSGGRTRTVAVGETAFGGRLTAVGASSATLDFAGESLELHLPGETLPAPPLPTPRPPAEPPEDPATPARDMSRRELERRIAAETPRILSETTLVPATEDGRIVGFTVTRVPDGTLLSDAGLRSGDVLVSVNGTPLDSLPTLIGLWPRLQNEARLQAVVMRGGRPVSVIVNLR
jgi:general secretion pathway protein C